MPFCHHQREINTFFKYRPHSFNSACGKISIPDPPSKNLNYTVCWFQLRVNKLSISMVTTWEAPLQKLLNHETTWSWSSTRQETNSKRSFNSSLEGRRLDVWCEKTLRQSEGVQNSRLTLSHWALWKLSHNSAPAVISSSSLPCHPLFQYWRQFPASRARLKPAAKNNQQ